MRQDDTPLDFFEPNLKKYPFAKEVRFIDAVLEAGDCLYVPAFYYIQSRTEAADGLETIMITSDYQAHSKIVDMILNGLEMKALTDEESHQFDQKMAGYLQNFF